MSRILIIEDEESIAELEKDYLELSGFEVEIENDGTEGLERALNEDFDLLILDLMLPGTRSAVSSGRRKTFQSLWFQPRKKILTRFAVWDWGRMIILQSLFRPVRWWRESKPIWLGMSGSSEAACRRTTLLRSGG